MKAISLFATLSLVLAMPCESAQNEVERLQQLCQQQDQKIRHLESQLKQAGVNPGTPATLSSRSNDGGQPAASDTYTVQSGDNVEKIARRNGCTAPTLNKLNGLKPSSIIHPGQRLKLPAKTQLAATEPRIPANPPASTPSKKPSETLRIHKIKQGETYSSISLKYKIPVNTLIALNPRIKATALRPGLNIRLNSGNPSPATKSESSLATIESKTKPLVASHSSTIATTQKPAAPAPSPASPASPAKKETTIASSQAAKTESPLLPAEKTTAQSPSSSPATPAERLGAGAAAASSGNGTPSVPQSNSKVERKIHSVKIEEPMTYGQFAAKYGTDAERLNDLNGLDLTQATVLAKGSELYVPAQP